jgi:cadmium resistance protein CadD (predicted permease)
MLETILLAITAFASTNVDNALLLLAFFADRTIDAKYVVIGQYLGMIVLTATAAVLALLAASSLPSSYIGLMGLLPILIGAQRLWRIWSRRDDGGTVTKPRTYPGAFAPVFSVASVTIANGGDNIAVFVPLFARSSAPRTLMICCVFGVLVAVWCILARWLTKHPILGVLAQNWGHRVTPFVLMALGNYILLRTR